MVQYASLIAVEQGKIEDAKFSRDLFNRIHGKEDEKKV